MNRCLTFLVSQFQIQISMGMCHLYDRSAGVVLDGIPQSALQSCALEVDLYPGRFQQDAKYIDSTVLQCSHDWSFATEERIDVDVAF